MKIAKILGALALLIIAVGAVWFFVIRDDPPEEVSLSDAVSSLNGTPTVAGGATPAATTASSTASTPESTAATGATNTTSGDPGDINGTWTIDSTKENFAGYRVQEELARVGATTAVGRTSAVTGTATIADHQVQAVVVTADLTKLRSDSDRRDGQLRTQGIETGRFPTATFTLDTAQGIPEGLAQGQAVTTTITGTLELHGVTKEISMPVEAQVVDGVLVIVGDTVIQFADYDITAPSAVSVLSIGEEAVLELQLFLTKS